MSTLLYGSGSWCLYFKQQRRLNAFHVKCLRRILGIKWTDKVTNNNVLEQAIHLLLGRSALDGWDMSPEWATTESQTNSFWSTRRGPEEGKAMGLARLVQGVALAPLWKIGKLCEQKLYLKKRSNKKKDKNKSLLL